jgi:hypothetical protein
MTSPQLGQKNLKFQKMTPTYLGHQTLTSRHYPTHQKNMKLIPTKPFQNLQNKIISIDTTVNMFIHDWIDNENKCLVNGVLTDEDQNKILQEISLNIGCWTPIVLMNTGSFDDDGKETYRIIHGSSLLNTIIDLRQGKFDDDISCEEKEWIRSRKIRVILYDKLSSDEAAALFSQSDMFKAANELQEQGKRLSVLDIEGRVFEGHE